MSKDLAIVAGKALTLPDHLKHLAVATSTKDLTDGVGAGFDVLKFKGKVWQVQSGDQRIPLLNEDNDPMASIELVLLKANPKITKTYYAEGYTEGADGKPTCWSNDGKTPSANVDKPCAVSCATCPNNVIGSKVGDDGVSKSKACSDNRRLAVMNLSYIPLDGEIKAQLLRLPYNSMKSLADLGRTLSAQNVPYNAVVVRARFDMTKAFPLVQFEPKRWMSADEAAQAERLLSDATLIDSILGDVEYATAPAPNGDAGFDTDDAPAAAPAKAAPAARPAATRAAAPVPAVEKAAPVPAPTRARKPAPVPPVPEPEPESVPPTDDAPVATGDDDLDDLFNQFDDEQG